jgi:hypothetical protein
MGSEAGVDTETLDLVGAITAMVVYVSSIVTFATRLAFGVGPGHWVGIPILLTALPLAFLLVTAPGADRPPLYVLQVGLMLAWVVLLFVLDYWLDVPWRDEPWQLISFVTLYFAGMGGMIGVAFLAGRAWGIAAIVLFLVAGTLAFVQRAVTGI